MNTDMINPPSKRIAIFIPTLQRARNLWRVVANIQEHTPKEIGQIYFIVEEFDRESIAEIQKLKQSFIINTGKGCYADAINSAYHQTTEPYFFMGADDLGFHSHWAEQALSHMSKSIFVVGTNDLGSIPIADGIRNSTHYLVARQYIKEQSGRIDEFDTVLYPYDHNYTDTEFTQVAKKRGVYVYCPASKVEHLHPVWGKGDWDEVYKRGIRTDQKDRQLFNSRKHLWA